MIRIALAGCLLVCGGIVESTFAQEGPQEDPAEIDFNTDIRPLLSDRCFKCHGPEEKSREAGLRFDRKDVAMGELESGLTAIVPGDVKQSTLVERITAADEAERMPPADSGKSLKPAEIELLTRWVKQGAPWAEHWAFVTPTRPDPPAVKDAADVINPIDNFIIARLEREKLPASPPADKTTLLRRVTFDLTGLPPTLDEIDAFLKDDSPEAYEKVVDRLLASPRYGEQMARYWLDAARYGDTHGLHLDNYREMWLYRDWVVRAFNDNKPFDQFIIEQLAGDLLPSATTDQQIATGFNRCNVTTGEGGSIVQEVYTRNVVDRVVTTGTVFMGLTLDCTRCHDHKYDPLTQKDFYSLFAFFNSLDGAAMDGNKKDHAPIVHAQSAEQKAEIANLQSEIEQTRKKIAAAVDAVVYAEPDNAAEPTPAEPKEIVWIEDAAPPAKHEGGWQFVGKPSPVYSGEKSSTRTATGLSQHYFHEAKEPLPVAAGDTLFAYVYLDPKNPPKQIMLQWNDGTWEHRAYWGGDHIPWGTSDSPSRRRYGDLPAAGEWVRLDVPVADVGLSAGALINGWAFTQFDGTVYWDKAGIVSTAVQSTTYDSLAAWLRDQRAAKGVALPADIKGIVLLDDEKRDDAQQTQLLAYFLEHAYSGTRDAVAPLHAEIAAAEARIEQLQGGGATTLVWKELAQPKDAFILKRGEYDQPLEKVSRAVPAVLPPLPEGAPLNRLGLAQWLVDPAHPLTARVTVNRFWQQLFGTGLVKTAEDFGSQGQPPSHPQLLDWLAVDFRDNDWDVKQLMKQVVMSATYRQSSHVSPELAKRDPENRLLARGPRFRLDAEMLRDQALAVSGLLVNKLGGPSVKPPQPDGLWFAVGYSGSNTVRFKQDTGPDKVYRRTLYTFLKRTAPPPEMAIFDAPSREACTVRRERTNTPLQMLLLMNDPQYVEAARALAQRAMKEGGEKPADRIAYLFRLCTARPPSDAESKELRTFYEEAHAEFQTDEADAAKLIAIGESPPDAAMEKRDLAAWTMVANLVLCLDEVVTKN